MILKIIMYNFFRKEDCNVISVDWNKLAGPAPWYGVAVNNAKNVGARTGDLLLFMMENFGLSASDVHVIGWSLGGQLVGTSIYKIYFRFRRYI